MHADVLKIVGQVAGIIIRKNIFPKLPPAEAYRLLRLITVAVWSVAQLGSTRARAGSLRMGGR